jgi:hypothetical protein
LRSCLVLVDWLVHLQYAVRTVKHRNRSDVPFYMGLLSLYYTIALDAGPHFTAGSKPAFVQLVASNGKPRVVSQVAAPDHQTEQSAHVRLGPRNFV